MYPLYGDGIHDDTQALQELIDQAGNELVLPSPKKRYLISQTLTLPSNFRLVLPRFAEIRLADNSNCVMLRNRSTPLPPAKDATDEWDFYFFLKEFDGEKPDCNIEVTGGIHPDGNCHYGVIRNLKGAYRDDLVALNADEGSAGPITDIEIDGLFAEECHSAQAYTPIGRARKTPLPVDFYRRFPIF